MNPTECNKSQGDFGNIPSKFINTDSKKQKEALKGIEWGTKYL